ncbi:MAG: hypothetical protein CMN30_33960 [Sandaracinus sp.]|nr:hypothetical protein [Sandaracinus sp.]
MTLYHRVDDGIESEDVPLRLFILCSDKRVANHRDVEDVAEVEDLAGPDGSCRYRLYPRAGVSLGEVRRTAISVVRELHPGADEGELRRIIKDCPDPASLAMMEQGLRWGHRRELSDLRVMAIELTVAQSDPTAHWAEGSHESNRIVAVHLAYSSNVETLRPERGPRNLFERLEARVKAVDPDLIVGFGLQSWALRFLESKTQRICMGRGDDAGLQKSPRYTASTGQWRDAHYHAPGRQLIDLLDIVGASKKLSRLGGIPDVARHFGIAHTRRDPAPWRLRKGEQDGDATADAIAVGESRAALALALAPHLIRPLHAIAQWVPMPLEDIVAASPGELVEAMMVQRYHIANEPLPVVGPVAAFPGPTPEVLRAGRLRNVHSLDFRGFYPTIIATEGIGPASDRLGVFVDLVQKLRSARLAALNGATGSVTGGTSANQSRAEADGLKMLVNAAYGALAYDRFSFGDGEAAHRIARRGEEILNETMLALEARGLKVLAFQTDGVLVQSDLPREGVEEIAKEARDSVCEEHHLRYEGGPYTALLTSANRNAGVLFDPATGRAIWKGRFRMGDSVPMVREAVQDCALGIVSDDANLINHLPHALKALRDGTMRVANLAIETQILAEEEETAYDQSARSAEAAWSRDPEYPLGAPLRWFVSRGDGPQYARAQLVTSNSRRSAADAEVDIDHYADQVRRHTRLLEDALGTPQLERLLAGEAVENIDPQAQELALLGGGDARWWAEDTNHPGSVVDGGPLSGRRPGSRVSVFGFRNRTIAAAHELAKRVRTGDLPIRFGLREPGDTSMVAKELVALLEQHGAVATNDLRIVCDGRSIEIWIRQAALAVPDLANLPAVYERIASRLERELRARLGPWAETLPTELFDRRLYAPRAMIPAIGVDVDGSMRSYATLDAIASGQLAASRGAPPDWPAVGAGSLHQLGEGSRVDRHETWKWVAQLRGRSSKDAKKKARAARRSAQAEMYEAAGVKMRAPCFDNVIDRLTAGEAVDERVFLKAVSEQHTVLGRPADDAAAALADATGNRRLKRRYLRLLEDEPPTLRGISDGERSCADAASVCEPAACHRAGAVPAPDAPSREEFVSEARAAVALAMDDPLVVGRPRSLEANLRGGKTTSAAILTRRLVREGERVLVLVPTHRAGETFLKAYKEPPGMQKAKGDLAVQYRGKNGATCLQEFGGQEHPRCQSCAHNVTRMDGPGRRQAPGVTKVRKRKRIVISESDLEKLAAGTDLCPRSAGLAALAAAEVVVMTFSAFANEGIRRWLESDRATPKRPITHVIVDEADQFPDLADGHVHHFPLASARSNSARTWSGRGCHGRHCGECSVEFVRRPSESGTEGPGQPKRLAVLPSDTQGLGARPRVIIERLRHAVRLWRSQGAEGRNLEAVEHNIELLGQLLVEPRKLLRAGEQHLSAADYLVRLGHHLAQSRLGEPVPPGDEEPRRMRPWRFGSGSRT